MCEKIIKNCSIAKLFTKDFKFLTYEIQHDISFNLVSILSFYNIDINNRHYFFETILNTSNIGTIVGEPPGTLTARHKICDFYATRICIYRGRKC